MEASEYASGHNHLGTASYKIETSQFNKILNVGSFKVCLLCWEFISGHFRTGGWR